MFVEDYKGLKAYQFKNSELWRAWLSLNYDSDASIWLVIYKKASNIETITYDQAVDDAICFGWIDSKINKRDDVSFYQLFSKRSPKSNWSRVNKNKVEKLLLTNKMKGPGLKLIEIAKDNGCWNALDKIENLELPVEMEDLFDQNKIAFKNWTEFPRSVKRGILEWIYNAKRKETKLKRIQITVEKAEQNIRANQYVKKI